MIRRTATYADQGLSAASNVLIVVLLARSGGPELVGKFALVFAVYLAMLGLVRALVADPLLLSGPTAAKRYAPKALTAVLVLSVGLGLISAGAGVALGRSGLLAAGLLMPLLGAQDFTRYLGFAIGDGRVAVAADGVWLAVVVLAGVLGAFTDLTRAITVWGLGAGAGMIAGLTLVRTTPGSFRVAHEWWRKEARARAGPLLSEAIFSALVTQGGVLGLAAIIGSTGLGEVRLAQTIVAPAALLLIGHQMYATPVVLALEAEHRPARLRMVRREAVLGTIVVCASVLLFGPWAGRVVFGAQFTWSLPMTLAACTSVLLASLCVAPYLRLRVQGRLWRITRVRTLTTGIGVVASLLLAWQAGPIGAIWGATVGVALFAVGLASAARTRARSDSESTPSATDEARVPPPDAADPFAWNRA